MSKAKKAYIIITSFFSLMVLITLTAEVFSYALLSNAQSNVAEKIYYNNKLAEKKEMLSNLSTSYKNISEYENLIIETLPKEKEASKLIADINSIAIKSNLKFTNVESINTESSVKTSPSKVDPSFLQTIKGKNGYEMPLSIKVEGSYSNVITFIRGLENYQRLIGITDLKIQEKDSDTINDFVEVTLNITAFLKR